MGLSLSGCAHGIRDLLTEKSEAVAGFSVPMIVGHIPTIAEAFAREIAADVNKRDLLRTGFQNTIADGVADLTTNLAAGLLLDTALLWKITLNPNPDDFPPFHMIAEASQLCFKRPGENMFITAAVDSKTLFTRDAAGDRDADLGAIIIDGSFIPVIAEDAAETTLPTSLHGVFQVYGARMLLGNIQNGKK